MTTLTPPLEKSFQRKVKKFLDELPESWFYKTHEHSLNGIPDYVGHVAGVFIALELKRSLATKSRQRKLQELNIKRINATGGYATICAPENWSEVMTNLLYIIKQGEKRNAETAHTDDQGKTRRTETSTSDTSPSEAGKVIELSKRKNRKKDGRHI